MCGPEVRVEQISRDGLDENAAAAPDQVQIDALADEDVPPEKQLVVQGPGRDGPAGEPEVADALVDAGGA